MTDLISLRPEVHRGSVNVDGVSIRWCAWPGDGPAIVLIHGGGAHVGWWLEVAQILSSRPVVAFDLSGHGDSGHRPMYEVTSWAREAHAIIETLTDGPVTVVAHSMGGRVGTVLAARWPSSVRSLVLVDSVIPTHDHESLPQPSSSAGRIFATPDQAISRFRLAPPSPRTPDSTRARLGQASIRRVDGGWAWKFDPKVFYMEDAAIVNRSIADIRCPVGVIIAQESGVTDPAMSDDLAELLGHPVALSIAADQGHHLIVDDPVGSAAIINDMIASLE